MEPLLTVLAFAGYGAVNQTPLLHPLKRKNSINETRNMSVQIPDPLEWEPVVMREFEHLSSS